MTKVVKEKTTKVADKKATYTVVMDFEDKFDRTILYKEGQQVPEHFTEERIKDLLARKLIK